MALTHEERLALEKAIKRIRKLEARTDTLELRINELQDIIDKLGLANNMNDWTTEEWDEFLRPYIMKYTRQATLQRHDHSDDLNGGPCFAQLGANLINGE